MDVNQTPALEGDLLYQMLKAYFNGDEYRKYVSPYLTPYNSSNVTELTLVPYDATAVSYTHLDVYKRQEFI